LFVTISDPASRPTFQELLERLKELQRRYAIQFQAARSAVGETLKRILADPSVRIVSFLSLAAADA
jgi:hypothetical protein